MQRRISIFFPLILISTGILWILIEMRIVQPSNLWALVYLWPLLLISAGLSLIFRSYWKYLTVVMDVVVIGGAFLAVIYAPKFGWTHAPDYIFNGNGFFLGTSEKGSGKIVNESRNVGDFHAISISYPAQVFVNQGEAETLTLQADDNVVAEIGSKVENGILVINNLQGHQIPISPTQPVKITITVKDLNELDFETAGEVRVTGLETDHLVLNMDGAGTLTLDHVNLKSMECNLSGVGSIQANGTADTLNVHVQGLGSFNGSELHSQTATVNLNGMGGATVWVDKNLNATVSGMGSVNYYGDAQLIKRVDGLGGIKYLGTK